jgi:hypothetical protein
MENKEILVRDYSNRSCQTCNLFNTNNSAEKACELKLENKCASYANDETLGDFWISCLDDESDSVLYKQETLEEFIKSQPYYGYCTTDYKEGIEVGAKWQAERMYSEEDLRNAYRWGTTVNHGTKEHFNEWFEQFKKK